jgi:hypothetical protein
MNYLKRIEIKKRPQHFQQGGNIAIGSPKPYTTTLPGVNFNPLTLNNAPIEINTTGISDQIEKMQRLAYDREVLAFKYKDLEYKEGKDYLDLFNNILKGVGSSAESINSMGGAAAFGQYKDQLSAYNAKRNQIIEEASRAHSNRDKDGAKNAALKLAQLETDSEVLGMKYKTKSLDAVLKAITEGKAGAGTAVAADMMFSHLAGGKDAPSFEDVIKFTTSEIGSAVKATDIQGVFQDYFKLLDPYDQDTSERDATGGIVTKTVSMQRSPETVVNAILAGAKVNPVLKSAFTNLGFNPAPATGGYDPNAVAYFTEVVGEQYKARSKPGISTKIVGGQAGEKYNTETGLIEKIPDADGSDGKGPSEGDKDYDRIMRAVRSTYGDAAANDPKMQAIAGGTGSFSDLWALIEADAKKAGYSANAAGGGAGRTGIVPGTESLKVPLPNTLEGIKKVVNYIPDPKITREKVVDGNRYLITSDRDLIDKLKNYAALKPTKYSDVELREKFGFKDVPVNVRTEKEDEWNSLPWQKDARVYNLGPATEASTTSAGFDPKNLGEPAAVKVKDLGLPATGDFKGEINSHLGLRAKDVLNNYKLTVTDTSDYKKPDGSPGHKSKAQQIYGTSFDVDFEKGEDVSKIYEVIQEFKKNGLRAVYEVKTQKEKNDLIAKDTDLAGHVIVEDVTGSHFSVYCDDCERLDVIKGQTPTNEVKKPGVDDSGLGKQRLSDWINK